MKPVKALFLGLGGVGQRHLRNLRQLRPDAGIAAVRHDDRRFEITPDLAADHSVDIVEKYEIALYPSIDEAMAFGPDFAVVATPSHAHASLARDLVRSEVPVFLEKPLSHDRKSLAALVDAVAERDVSVMVGCMLRFNPAVRRLRGLVLCGTLGRLYSAHVVANTFMPGWHPYEDYRELYAARESLGGGVILTNIHLIDLITWVLGRPRRLWCCGGNLSEFALDVEDCVSALFDYEIDGRPVPVTCDMSFVQLPVENTITFRGAAGQVRWSLDGNRVSIERAEDGTCEVFEAADYEWNQMFIDEIAHFLDCLENRKDPEPGLADVLVGQEVALAMKESLAGAGLARP